MDNSLILALQNPDRYDHPVSHFQVIETHISWVLLTGNYAYKIKKPVNLGFLNFSSLAKRHHYCLRELALNRRLAPQIYLDVVAIGGNPESPVLGAEPSIEYAVKMRQFPQSARLDAVLASGALKPEHIDQLADHIAAFHGQVEIAVKDSLYGNPATVLESIEGNFQQIFPLLSEQNDITQLEALKNWSLVKHTQLLPQINQRKTAGFVRNCHGDMHLANIALLDKKIIIFDCIEFSESLRWIDVISEIAFITMDLIDRGHPNYAARLLDRYLQRSGDYGGLAVFQFYHVHRALVRAKVAIIRIHQRLRSKHEKQLAFKQYREYVALAEKFTHSHPQTLFITHGVSGSGKTTHTQPLLEKLNLIHLRSDVERKRLFGLKIEEQTDPTMISKVYSADVSQRTYHHLLTTAKQVCQHGFSVIIDATFLKQAHRQPFQALAKELNIPFVILHFHAEEQHLHQWIKKRAETGTDASEATIEVLQHQLTILEPLSENEADHIISIDSGDVRAIEQLSLAVNRVLSITS
tara:strand:+ start:820 stop:2388 length:1569 start_codon:yes stop_codon:yes gene_type:complete